MPSLLPGLATLPGSLVHPILMLTLMPCWLATFILGIQARRRRLDPPSTSELTGLLSNVISDNKAHHKLAAATYFCTVLVCFLGMANTYSRSGRLFPGPHLYGGLAVILAGSFNVALVPWFKDFPGARFPHVIMGLVIMVLLTIQIKTGLKILVSVWKLFH